MQLVPAGFTRKRKLITEVDNGETSRFVNSQWCVLLTFAYISPQTEQKNLFCYLKTVYNWLFFII